MENKVCTYAICKDEEKKIENYLLGVKDADLVYILDTGSTDATYYIAAKVAEENNINMVYDVGQRSHYKIPTFKKDETVPSRVLVDFSKAKNAALDRCMRFLNPISENTTWIFLALDIDEVLHEGSIDYIREHWTPDIDNAKIGSYNPGDDSYLPVDQKVHSYGFRWKRPIHEELFKPGCSRNSWNTVDFTANIQYTHDRDLNKDRSQYLYLLEYHHIIEPNNIKTLFYLMEEYKDLGEYETMANYARLCINAINNPENKDDPSYEDKYLEYQCYIHTAILHRNTMEFLKEYVDLSCASIVLHKSNIKTGLRILNILLAKVCWNLGYKDRSVGFYRDAINTPDSHCWLETEWYYTHEGYANLLNMTGLAEYYNNNFEESRDLFKLAIQHDPGNEQYKANLEFAEKMINNTPRD